MQPVSGSTLADARTTPTPRATFYGHHAQGESAQAALSRCARTVEDLRVATPGTRSEHHLAKLDSRTVRSQRLGL